MISLEHFKISKTLIFIINFNNLVRSVIIGRISMILVCDMFLFLCSVFAGGHYENYQATGNNVFHPQ